eukprot:7285784-Heterocapsa_arctica.AAC.1
MRGDTKRKTSTSGSEARKWTFNCQQRRKCADEGQIEACRRDLGRTLGGGCRRPSHILQTTHAARYRERGQKSSGQPGRWKSQGYRRMKSCRTQSIIEL